MKYLKFYILVIMILVLISFNIVFAQPDKNTLEIRDGDFITKNNFLFQGDQSCYNNDPNDMDCWKFRVGELYSGPPTVGNINIGEFRFRGPTIGIENDFTIDDDKDRPPTVGECIALPFIARNIGDEYARICLKRLNVDETSYNTFEVKYDNSKDLSNGGTPSQTSEPIIEIAALEGLEHGLVVYTYNFTDLGGSVASRNITTDKIWLHINDTTSAFIDVFYEDVDNRPRWAGSLIPTASNKVDNIYQKFGEINYRQTTGNNIQLALDKSGELGLVFDIQGEEGTVSRNSADDIRLSLKNSTTAFSGFGKIAEQSEASELIWAWNYISGDPFVYVAGNRTIGTKDEDHRTRYGIIIRAPDNSLLSDTLTLEIPADQVKVVTAIEGCMNSVCGGLVDEIPLDTYINSIIGRQLDAQDIATFQDTSILFRPQYYDIHDELDIGMINASLPPLSPVINTGPIIVTSLSAGDDDYESGIFMEVPRRTITYSYLFDQSIPLNSTSLSKPLVIKVLGKTLKIVKINSPNSFVIRKFHNKYD